MNQVFIYRNYVDMRKGHNGLSYLVRHEMNLDLLSGSIFLFAGRNRRSAKALMWDGTGLLLIHKKLESGKFMSFKNLKECELERAISGLEPKKNGRKLKRPLVRANLHLVEVAGIEPASKELSEKRTTCVVSIFRQETRLFGLRAPNKPQVFFRPVSPTTPANLILQVG